MGVRAWRSEGLGEGRDREKRRAGGAKMESVPVPVLVCLLSLRIAIGKRRGEGYRSGRCSPLARMERIRFRY